jgi:flavin-dependent dehydrogenase
MRPWSDLVEVHWQELGEAYVTPVADDEVGIAMLFDERSLAGGEATLAGGEAAMDRLLSRFPELCRRVAAASYCSTVRGAGPFEQRAARVVDGRILLAGDAAGYLDPITGEGLRLGFLAGIAAVDALVRDRPAAYEREWRRLVRRYWWSTTALLALRRSPAAGLMMPALRLVPSLFDSILDSLGAAGNGPQRSHDQQGEDEHRMRLLDAARTDSAILDTPTSSAPS